MLLLLDQTTLLLSAARFSSALARLCLGPLLPLLTVYFTNNNSTNDETSKSLLLSSYSSGYILTQIVGGYLADKYGSFLIVSLTVGISCLILLFLITTSSDNTDAITVWTKAYFFLGFVSGPLFPAGSTAISSNVPREKRAASNAIVDAAAAAGTMVAAFAPVIADRFGWRMVYYWISFCLGIVTIFSILFIANNNSSISSNNNKNQGMKQQQEKSSLFPESIKTITINSNNDNTITTTATKLALDDKYKNMNTSSKYPITALLAPAAIATYICHSADNFTKYSVNAWTATMLVERYNISPTTVGLILVTQEAIGVLSRLLTGILVGPASFTKRGWASVFGFTVQGLALWSAFRTNNILLSACMLIVSSLAVGAHSVGFRPIYFESSPEHAGSISGFGNTIASLASIIGPVIIGTTTTTSSSSSWNRVGMILLFVNLGIGATAATAIARVGMKRTFSMKKLPYNSK